MVPPSACAPATMTVADLLEQLGNIPPERVRLHPAPGSATEADVLEIEDRENRLFELVDGALVEKAMGFRESLLAIAFSARLQDFVRPGDLGLVVGADGMMRLAAGLVRMSDVAFISWARLPNRRVPTARIPALAPDIAVEILSRTNTREEMARKRREYFEAGVALVWIVDPDSRTVAVYTDPDRATILGESDTLSGAPVLPEFSIELRGLFAELDRTGPEA